MIFSNCSFLLKLKVFLKNMRNLKIKLINMLVVIAILFLCNFLSGFFWGFFLTLGGNIRVVGFNEISFDPLITIAYMILYYFITLFYQPNSKAQYYLFLFTLFLSFTVNFIQGAIYLVFLYMFLRFAKLI